MYPEFLGTLAHELRNALAPMRISMHVVKLSTSGNANVEESFAIIERQMRSFISLIDDIQDVSRFSRGVIALQKGKLGLADLLGASVDSCRALLESAEVQIHLEPPPPTVLVEGDFDRLQQVFNKVLQNAAKYSAPGGEVTIRCLAEGDQIATHVIDTGIGIEPEMLEKVFDLFHQINDPQAHRRGGLGIGLTLARDILRLHGGAIEAKSEGKGRGSEFIIRLPLAGPDK
jgi:signal transduction histidine kinase